MGPYYEICPVGESVVWVVWRDRGIEKTVLASEAQREWLSAVTDRHDRELQRVLRDIANGNSAAQSEGAGS